MIARLRVKSILWPANAMVTALLLRLAVLPWAIGRLPRGDPLTYVQLATNMAAGHGMRPGIPPLLEAAQAHYPPLYPLILAAVGLVASLNPPALVVVNWSTDTAIAASIWLISRNVGLADVGKRAAIIFLFWPTNLLMAPVAQKENLAALLACLVLAALLTARSNSSKGARVLFGVFSGLLALTQPALATLPCLFALVLLPHFKSWHDWLRTIAIGCITAGVVILPWVIRNYSLFGQFVPLTDSGGAAFWIGTMPYGSGNNWFPLTDHLMAHGNGVEISKAAAREARSWILVHPGAYVRHTISKAIYMLGPDRWDMKPLAWMLPALRPPIVFIVVPLVASLGLFAFAAIGAVLIRNSVIRPIVLACLIQLFVVQIWFEFPERHRYFMVPLLMILAVEGARLLVDDLKHLRRARRLGASEIV